MTGVAGESNACYIKSIFGQTSASGVPVLINSNNKLGTATSSKRFKEHIKRMDKASEALFALKPITFRYKKELDPTGTPQFGLIAKEVAAVNLDLVVRDEKGEIYTVRYDQVNAMLLNEFLKEHRAFVEEKHKVAQEKEEIDALKAELKDQRTLIDEVSAKLEVGKSATKVVTRDP
jgi:septal ring factor EnvC (AmiA/AmiB activator)